MSKTLNVDFLGRKFSSPLVLVSGIYSENQDFLKAENNGAGAITTKSYTYFPRQGHSLPVVAKFPGGFLNSVGLKNAGIVEAKKQIRELKKILKVPLLVSIFDTKVKEFVKLTLDLLPLAPEFIELNLSCPNVDAEFGKPSASSAEGAYEIVRAVKKILGRKTKIIAKLTPNVLNIAEVAKACEQAGADAISAINTVSQGMIIDIKTKKPVLGNKQGGVSGPAIKPISVRCVYDIYEAVKIPIIGMGGITTADDAIEMFMAGASLIGIGSAIYLKGMKVFGEINTGIFKYLKENNYKTIKDIVGLAH